MKRDARERVVGAPSLAWFSFVALACACSARSVAYSVDPPPASAVEPADEVEASRVEPLRAFERELRARMDVRALPSSEIALGPDPWQLLALPEPTAGAAYVGVLRGRSAVVLLDAELRELARKAAPRSTTGLALLPGGVIAAAGELSNEIAFFTIDKSPTSPALREAGSVRLAAEGIRDLAAGPDGALAAIDPRGQRLFWLPAGLGKGDRATSIAAFDTCKGAAQLLRTKNAVAVMCTIDHAIDVMPIVAGAPAPDRRVRLGNDGPFFGAAAIEEGDALTVAAGGVEDHPLDRTQGSFGFIDSFVHVFRVTLASGKAERIASIDVSQHQVVTPKALWLTPGSVRVAGYGTSDVVTFALPSGQPLARSTSVPGLRTAATKGARTVFANPLFDAWVMETEGRTAVVPVTDAAARTRSAASRLGEALIFTTLIAPWNRSEGRLSRFTCETCHFEGTIDGRVHHTGRGDVRAATKPILGLLNNNPHFSRALDPDLAVLSMNEFRAANAKSDHDAFFTLESASAPWLAQLGVEQGKLGPDDLRRAFMTFLAEFSHRPNPRVIGRHGFNAEERRGAAIFRERCEGCHAAKLAADGDATFSLSEWEPLVFSNEGPLVWGNARYELTGVTPYVHALGARVPSLRRVYAKHPYFTNGSAHDLDAVLERAREDHGTFLHHAPDVTTGSIPTSDRRALKAFLELL